MTKAQVEYMSQFHVGDSVVIKYAGSHKDVIGKKATIQKVIKTRMTLMVIVEEGFYPLSELLQKAADPNYRMRKHYKYYPSAYNVEKC